MSVSEEEQNEKPQQAKLALRRIFVMFFTLICSFIFMELEIKGFANFGGWGVIFGFVVGLLALLGEDWTKMAVLASLKEAAQPFKYMMILIASLFLLVVMFKTAVKAQIIFITPNGIMNNLHYYYFSPSPEYVERVLSVLMPWLFLVFAATYVFNTIRKTEFF